MNRKLCTVYDAEKYYLTRGKGCVSIPVFYDSEDDYISQCKELRNKQKEINREFKMRRRKNEIHPTREQGLQPLRTDLSSEMKELLGEPSKEVELDLDKGTGNTLLLLGASKQGKSCLLMYLFRKYYNTKNYIATLFTISSQINVYKDLDGKDYLIRVPCFNNEGKKLIRMAKSLNTKTNNKYNFVFMFDDIITAKHAAIIQELFLTYRNSNISCIISLQYGFLLSKQSRSNVNNICLFRFLSDESIEVVVRTYLQAWFRKIGIHNREDQMNVYKELTKDHQFLYLNPREDKVSLHKLKL